MALSFKWVGEAELDRVISARLYCYGGASNMLEQYAQRLRADPRARPGDWLLAERDGIDVGTTTSLSMNMWVRGARMPCQGVAWVGTIKTHRRTGRGGERGIASQLMFETLRRAREREQVVSALMPFRGSYYEHFGYGLVERRNEWTVPLSILPAGDFEGMRFYREGDLAGMAACRQRAVERGQCDIERTAEGWTVADRAHQGGFVVVDEPVPGGPIQSYMYFTETSQEGKTRVNIVGWDWDSPEAWRRQLHFLASLRDQYSAIVWQLPADLPLPWLLKERQLPHRPVEHPVARVNPITRMQVRILDHARFLSALKLPGNVSGALVVAIQECEGGSSTLALEFDGGRIAVKRAVQEPDIRCNDATWAAIACGELKASLAAHLGLIQCSAPPAAALLDALAEGPLPFCNEYF